MCKFYRYIIYKLYSWGLKRTNDTPVANVIITLSIVHLMQLMTLYSILARFVTFIKWNHVNPILLYFMIFTYIGLNYLILYNKKKWKSYIKEFEKENDKQKKKGTIMVLSYLIGSILMFYIVLILLFHTFRNNFIP